MKSAKEIDPLAYERTWKTRALRGVVRFYCHAWHHVEALTPCKLPKDGPAILVCNHAAGIDPLLLQATSSRIITWMMAREYYDLPVLKNAFDMLGFIPVSRGMRDTASIKAALRALAAGKILGIFPEGRIETSTELLPFQPGVEMMAERTGVPIYPAYIAGIQRNMSIGRSMLDRQRVTINYGNVIPPEATAARTVEALQSTIEALRLQTFAAVSHQSFGLASHAT